MNVDDFLNMTFEADDDSGQEHINDQDAELDNLFISLNPSPVKASNFITKDDIIQNNQRELVNAESPIDDLLGKC